MNQDTIWFSASILLIGALLAFWVRDRIKRKRARAWPAAPGRVESSSVKLQGSGTQQSRYIANVIYSYDLDGESYSGHLQRSFILHGRAHGWIESFPKGRAITVRYNPQKVGDSLLFEDEQTSEKTA
jgi:hypothetical protein